MRERLMAGCLLLLVPISAGAGTVEYAVDQARSSVAIHVGKSGAFSFAGHRHEVTAPVSGTVRADAANLAGSSLDLRLTSAALRVVPEGEPEGDAPKVQEAMLGPKVLDASRFPEIRFVSKAVQGHGSGPSYDLTIVGDLTLHGVTRELAVPARVTVDGRTLTAAGKLTVRHDQFEMKPVSVAGGAVKVANDIRVDFTIVATRR